MSGPSFAYPTNDEEHRHLREQLAEYAALQVLGIASEQLPEDLARHVDGCAGCREWLAEAPLLAEEVYSGSIPAAPAYPVPDLAFLRAPTPRPGVLRAAADAIGRLVIRLPDTILDTLRLPSYAGALRGLASFEEPVDGVEHFDVTVTVGIISAGEPDVASIRVACKTPGRGPFENGGRPIRLLAGELDRREVTNAGGLVVFAGVPHSLLPAAQVLIEPLAGQKS